MGKITTWVCLLVVFFTAGCAVAPDPRDPIEDFNRAVFDFNKDLDNALLKPAAKGWRATVPKPVNQGIRNFFANLREVPSTLNLLFQFRFKHARSNTARLLINSTWGLGGLLDVATQMKINHYPGHFGQTLQHWGVGYGPYLILPVLGPTTLRDSTRFVVDQSFDPLNKLDAPTKDPLLVMKSIQKRSTLLDASGVLERVAIDQYGFIKESYFQATNQPALDEASFMELDPSRL